MPILPDHNTLITKAAKVLFHDRLYVVFLGQEIVKTHSFLRFSQRYEIQCGSNIIQLPFLTIPNTARPTVAHHVATYLIGNSEHASDSWKVSI